MGAFMRFGLVPNAWRTSIAFAGRSLFKHEWQQRILDVANGCRTCVYYTMPDFANAVRVLSQHTRTCIPGTCLHGVPPVSWIGVP
jgi:hypothetical protein